METPYNLLGCRVNHSKIGVSKWDEKLAFHALTEACVTCRILCSVFPPVFILMDQVREVLEVHKTNSLMKCLQAMRRPHGIAGNDVDDTKVSDTLASVEGKMDGVLAKHKIFIKHMPVQAYDIKDNQGMTPFARVLLMKDQVLKNRLITLFKECGAVC